MSFTAEFPSSAYLQQVPELDEDLIFQVDQSQVSSSSYQYQEGPQLVSPEHVFSSDGRELWCDFVYEHCIITE